MDVISGVVDPDFEGEISVVVVNNTDYDFTVKKGTRFAQVNMT